MFHITRPMALVVAMVYCAGMPLRAQVNSPGGLVPAKLLQSRRAALLSAMPPGVAFISSSRIRSIDGKEYPQDADYRENNDFFYYTGVESPGGTIIFIKPDSMSKGEIRLYLNAPPAVADAWSAARTSADTTAARITGLTMDEICRNPGRSAAPAGMSSMAGGRGAAATTPAVITGCAALPIKVAPAPPALPPIGLSTSNQFEDVTLNIFGPARQMPTPPRSPDSLAKVLGVPLLGAGAISRAINNSRGVKDADEIRRLTKASEISAEGHRAAMMNTRPGMWEYEVEAVVEYTFRRRGAERLGYPSIVGSGPNSTILHYDLSRRQTKDGDLMLIDAAAEYGYYTADLTRTYPVNGKFTPRQKAIYELVLGAQQAAMDSVHPGQTIARLGLIAAAYLREKGGTLCGEVTCDRMMGHGLSHSVGMDVHDVNPAFREMQAGYAFTIEPGVYLPKEGFGIRIEDTILVTENGYLNLTAGVPRTVKEIEALMAAGKKNGVDAIRP